MNFKKFFTESEQEDQPAMNLDQVLSNIDKLKDYVWYEDDIKRLEKLKSKIVDFSEKPYMTQTEYKDLKRLI